MKKIFSLIVILTLTACGVSSTDGVVSRGKNSSGFMGLSTNDDVEVTGKEALKGVKDVVIASFKVGFSESSVAHKKAGGGLFSSGSGGNAKGKVKLEGISESLRKEITETAYNDFVAKLKSNGYNVISRSKLTSSEQYGKAKKYKFPYLVDNSGWFSDYGKTYFYQPASFGNEGILFSNDIQGETGGFAFANGNMQASEYAKANNVAVISATYFVDFVAAGGHGGRWSTTASVEVGQNLAVTSGSLKVIKDYSSTFNAGQADVKLGQPVESGKEFGTIKDVTTTTDKTVQEVTNVLSIVMGQGTNRSRDYVIKANPSKFKAQTIDVLKDTNKALIAKAASLR